jgi:hypothetical protein
VQGEQSMAHKAYQLGAEARKIDPKLRMIANGDHP